MTQLFFFKKIKHEFCHVMSRFVSIYERKRFNQKATPEKYTPFKQRSRRAVAVPEIGDHDEEEDTGGVILPLYFNKKLSLQDNPLCLFFGNKYLKLTDTQIDSLLGLDYTSEIHEERHDDCRWSAFDCRAVQQYAIDRFFYSGESVPRVDIVPKDTSSSLSSKLSSPSKRSRGESSDDISGQPIPAWRLCEHPCRVPFSIAFPQAPR